MSKRLDLSLGDLQRQQPAGGIDNAISQTLWGINHRKTPSAVPLNKDDYGLTFFTRPRLNLSLENIRHNRYFNQLATFEPDSVQRIISCTLDPRLHYAGVSTSLIDHDNCFIPILSNHLESMSGWPDSVVESYSSEPGIMGESFSFVDSKHQINDVWQLSATFRNMTGDIITSLIDYWRVYSSLVYLGTLIPYYDFIIKNEIDYMTRVWRLVLDPTKTYVQKIACTGASYPISVPYGRSFDYQSESPLNSPSSQIDIQFQCIGALYNDPILIYEFNTIVATFNPSMRPEMIKGTMRKVPVGALTYFNFRGYPKINVGSYELEWYVSKTKYDQVLAYYRATHDELFTDMNKSLIQTGSSKVENPFSKNAGASDFTSPF